MPRTAEEGGSASRPHQMLGFAVILMIASKCFRCLEQGRVWCIDYAAKTETCIDKSTASSCVSREQHDVLFNASQCCFDLKTPSDCLSVETRSFCGWCPYETQKCLYKHDVKVVEAVCPGPLETGGTCGEETSTVRCTGKYSCVWNANVTSTQCQPQITALTLSPGTYTQVCPVGMTFDAAKRQCGCVAGNSYANSNMIGCTECRKAGQVLDALTQTCRCNTSAGLFQNAQGDCIQCTTEQIQVGQTCVCTGNQATTVELLCVPCKANQKVSADTRTCLCRDGPSRADGTCKLLSSTTIGVLAVAALAVASVAIGLVFYLKFCPKLRRKARHTSTGIENKPQPAMETTAPPGGTTLKLKGTERL